MYPQVFGKYVLERELARGGMARVLLATLRGAGGFEKKLVVKQIRDDLALDTDFVRRFVEEAKTTVALSHPNIVPVYELGVEQGTYFLAMELVEGVSLSEIMAHTGTLTPEEAAYVGVEICRALDYAHRRMHVVHRDITPRNVMVDEEGQIKLIDFGIAARARVTGTSGSEPEQVFGSPGHMPPEQVEGKELGPATDLFAVGVLLMELWSGKAPFRRKTPEECMAAMQAPHPKPSDANAQLAPLDDVITRTMALASKDRPQKADDLGRALRKFLVEADLGDVARGLGQRARRARAEIQRRADAETVPSMRPREPSHAELVTKTFAARDEVLETSEAGTRRIGSERPPGVIEVSREPRIETIATRPLITPAHDFKPAVPVEKKLPTWPLYVTGGLAVVAGIIALRSSSTPESRDSSTKQSKDVPSATSASTAPSAAPTEPTATAAKTLPVEVAPSAKTAALVSATAAATESRAPAHLSVFCDPDTRVTIDGAARGACPLRDLAVDPGAHEVRFVFEPTGESRGERVHVAAGGRITLRADFTGSTPMVRVER